MSENNSAAVKAPDAGPKLRAERTIELAIELGDIKTFSADVLALKYAQQFYGADRVVAEALAEYSIAKDSLRVPAGESIYVDSRGALAARHVLFVGVPPVKQLSYAEVQAFARDVLRALGAKAPQARHLVMTVHGGGFGLDEERAFRSQLYGYLEALEKPSLTLDLERISIISNNERKVADLRQMLSGLSEDNYLQVSPQERGVYRLGARGPKNGQRSEDAQISQASSATDKQKHVFVAMPFSKDMEDVYHYGIRQAITANGYLCARIDHEIFSGSIFEQIKKKIDDAAVLIADLSGANANVYLELGYAIGKGIPTIQLVRDVKELKFDVQAERCLVYDSIRTLEAKLTDDLRALKARQAGS